MRGQYSSSADIHGAKFQIQTFGCQMNKHDSERIVGMLEALGATEVTSTEDADIVVFMTCCVREGAETRLEGHVASIKNTPLPLDSKFGHRIIAIGGCIGQRDGERLIERLSHVDVVFGTHNIAHLPALIQNRIDALEGCSQNCVSNKSGVEVLESSTEFSTDLPSAREHSWAAWLPITTGCDNFCTYCIVPYVRGREHARPLEDIAEEAASLVADGVREITLLGQNVNSYGRDLYGEPRFADVLDAVAQTGVERIRFATSHPKDLSDAVIERFATIPSLMPALHLPVQSGSNNILKAMNRRYTREHYLELVKKLREVRPDIALSTDIIVGFPSETEQDFLDTLHLVQEVGYSQVFSFIYSPREGTPAAKMQDDTPREVIQERFNRLLAAIETGAFETNQVFKGTVQQVLVEGASKKESRVLTGKNPHNVTVHAELPQGINAKDLAGQMVDVRITDAKTFYIFGEVVSSHNSEGDPHA
jgi:tRNA-2-methylthio-N6-dimethylallyladenosine synthase